MSQHEIIKEATEFQKLTAYVAEFLQSGLFQFVLGQVACQIVFKTGAAAVPVHYLHTVVYPAVQKFVSQKHSADQER